MPTATAAFPEAPADDPVIRVSREVRASRDLVWSAWTDPSRVSQWWGPQGFSTTTHSHDLRPGGTWSFTMHGPDGTDYINRVVFEAVEPPARLAYNHYGPDDPEDAPHFRARVTFAETAAGTLVTLTMRCASVAARDHLVAFGAVEGGRDTLARFAALVEAGLG
jgi:uncharacterized protein YndB with AHSA1/START domain